MRYRAKRFQVWSDHDSNRAILLKSPRRGRNEPRPKPTSAIQPNPDDHRGHTGHEIQLRRRRGERAPRRLHQMPRRIAWGPKNIAASTTGRQTARDLSDGQLVPQAIDAVREAPQRTADVQQHRRAVAAFGLLPGRPARHLPVPPWPLSLRQQPLHPRHRRPTSCLRAVPRASDQAPSRDPHLPDRSEHLRGTISFTRESPLAARSRRLGSLLHPALPGDPDRRPGRVSAAAEP